MFTLKNLEKPQPGKQQYNTAGQIDQLIALPVCQMVVKIDTLGSKLLIKNYN